MTSDTRLYGKLDASFEAAGGQAGIQNLVDAFYGAMSRLPEAQRIRKMHADDLTDARHRLTLFLCGWLGGPRLYQEKYGEIRLPMFHVQFDIGEAEKAAWLLCMEQALAEQPYTEEFRTYLLAQFTVPAERIRFVCAKRKADPAA